MNFLRFMPLITSEREFARVLKDTTEQEKKAIFDHQRKIQEMEGGLWQHKWTGIIDTKIGWIDRCEWEWECENSNLDQVEFNEDGVLQ